MFFYWDIGFGIFVFMIDWDFDCSSKISRLLSTTNTSMLTSMVSECKEFKALTIYHTSQRLEYCHPFIHSCFDTLYYIAFGTIPAPNPYSSLDPKHKEHTLQY
jgi:hypothetical protein